MPSSRRVVIFRAWHQELAAGWGNPPVVRTWVRTCIDRSSQPAFKLTWSVTHERRQGESKPINARSASLPQTRASKPIRQRPASPGHVSPYVHIVWIC